MFTFLESFACLISFGIFFIIVALIIYIHSNFINIFKYNKLLFSLQSLNKKSQVITNLFANTMISVSICILAVDFSVFPSRFSKTKMYGCSVMDIGVSGFLALNATLSPQARQNAVHDKVYFIKKAVLSSVPLIICGLIRVVLIKITGYHQEITEYGLNWNFFFTLAFTKVR